ncbi:hypothetical protein SBRY_20704 [Actinacidiphila bryophytorum]|uniref:Uncharacterized protein n=1 Tax=Actinacidiphila bryophytorum TaxID=1436133 RepID=A0A9W4E4L0_9ACTN|nr:hypothetical protein SBRY_20704 [Actinacidiphila bryophytorum]
MSISPPGARTPRGGGTVGRRGTADNVSVSGVLRSVHDWSMLQRGHGARSGASGGEGHDRHASDTRECGTPRSDSARVRRRHAS